MKKILISILVLCLMIGAIGISTLSTEKIPNLTRLFATETEKIAFLGDAANAVANKTTVHRGETFDVTVTLGVGSLGWEITFNNENGEELITNEEIIPTFSGNGVGQNGEIYFIQVMPPFTTYEVGTVVATKRYTVSETAIIGSTITIDVTGMIADSSWGFHDIAESVTVEVVEQTSNQDLVIKYVEKNNNTNILDTEIIRNIEVGTEQSYTVPKDYIKDGLLWRTTNFGAKTHTMIDGPNEVIIEYEKVLADVIIKYVEKNNNTNILNTITEENKQVGSVHSYTVPKDYIKDGLLWRTTNFGAKTYTMIEGTNEIIVEYEKVLAEVIIKYIDTEEYNYFDPSDDSGILETITANVQVGGTYNYTIEEDYIIEGLLWRTGDFGTKTHTVVEEDNEIIIEYNKVKRSVQVEYVDINDSSIVWDNFALSSAQVGTTVNYTVPEEHVIELFEMINGSAVWVEEVIITTDYGLKTVKITEER